MRDFTFSSYRKLLDSIINSKLCFQPVEDFFASPSAKAVILRHDVDSWPVNAMQMAKIESERGIRSTYYFRMSPLSYNEKIIKRIAALGHEIGYHYEDLTTLNGNYDKAIKTFEYNLAKIRQYYPVKTIAMHGKPLSQWDNLDLWSKYDYKDFGIIGEPYLSINFNEVLYLTDTGNCWDGEKYSIRDSVKSKYKFNIHTTNDLIENLKNGLLPEQIMLNIHPARWNDNLLKWMVRYYMLTVPKYTAKKWVKQWRKRQS